MPKYIMKFIDTHKHKIAIGILSIFLLLALGGLFIFKSKNNIPKLPDSVVADQTAQYNAAASSKPIDAATNTINIKKTTISAFYRAYLLNKKIHNSQDSVFTKYGTPNLAQEYKDSTGPIDGMTCSTSNVDLTQSSITVGDPVNVNGQEYFLATFRNDKYQTQAFPEVILAQQGSAYLVDSTKCPGTF